MSVEDGDIPFLTEVDEVSSGTISRNHSHGHSLQLTPPHSRSPSFRDDHFLLERKRSSSLEDLRRSSINSVVSCHHHRKSSSRRSRRSQYGDYDSRKSFHRSSRHSSRRGSRPSVDERRRSVHIPNNRRRSSTQNRSITLEQNVHQRAKEQRRRRIVYIVIATFLLILLLCVLIVVVTLTHQSEFSLENKTTIYYTFSPHPKLIEHVLSVSVRKENEELMNSLSREPQSVPNTTSPVPD